MRAIAAREPAALRGLFDRHAPLLLGIATQVLRDRHEAEDLVNEVLLEIWNKPDRFSADRSAPKTYLVLVVRSRAIDRLRRKPVPGDRRAPASVDWLAEGVSAEDGPAAGLEAAERRDRVRSALVQLPDEQRVAIEQVYFGGMSHREMAEQTDTPLGTAKSRVRLGLIRLRGLLNGEDEGNNDDTDGNDQKGGGRP